MDDNIADVRALFANAAATGGNDGLFGKEELAEVLLDIGFTQEQVDATWKGAKVNSDKISHNELLDYISNGPSRCTDAGVASLCQYIRQRNLCELSDADISYLEENNIPKVLDVLLARLVKMKPLDTDRFCTDLFSGILAKQKRLVLMSSNCPDIDVLRAAVKPTGDMGAEIVTSTWKFEENPESLSELVKNLVNTHGTFKTVALCCHGTGSDAQSEMSTTADGEMINQKTPQLESKKWLLMQNHGVDVATGKADPGVNEAIQAVADAASVRVDILACSLAATKEGQAWVTSWENTTKKNFAASTNLTGNVEQGADWILETDGIDVMKVYFDKEKLFKWEGVLNPKTAKGQQEWVARQKGKGKGRPPRPRTPPGGGSTTDYDPHAVCF